mgnify:CR=1 FL=1
MQIRKAAVIGGGSSAASAAISASLIAPEQFNLTAPMDMIKLMLITFGVQAPPRSALLRPLSRR